MNARAEFLNAWRTFGKPTILAACLRLSDRPIAVLKVGYTMDDFSAFLSALDFEYKNNCGANVIRGDVWCYDTDERHRYTWFSRTFERGEEWWSYNTVPPMPPECEAK